MNPIENRAVSPASRVIKFRAWDTEERCFLKDNDFIGHHDDLYFGSMNRILSELNERNNTILMQFIGLNDRYGREIWEGDLIKLREFIYQVGFCRGEFYAWSKEKDLMPDLRMGQAAEHVEVIGNIYENPELLDNQEPQRGEDKEVK